MAKRFHPNHISQPRLTYVKFVPDSPQEERHVRRLPRGTVRQNRRGLEGRNSAAQGQDLIDGMLGGGK